MDLVLGLSATSTAVRWVLVEGVTGGGAPIDRGALDITDIDAFDAEALLTVLLDANEAAVESGVHAVGVTWTSDGDGAASAILDALDARDLQNVVSVSEIEAAEALAGGVADIAGYDDIAVCIFEPDATLVAVVDADGVTVDRQDRPTDGTDNIELAASVIALDLNDRQLDAIFAVGSVDLDPVVASLDTVAAAPVISSAEADMAMARGAAVASALAVNGMATTAAPLVRLRNMSQDRGADVRPGRCCGHACDLALGCAGSSRDSRFAFRTDQERQCDGRAGCRCDGAVGGEGRAGGAETDASRGGTAEAGSCSGAQARSRSGRTADRGDDGRGRTSGGCSQLRPARVRSARTGARLRSAGPGVRSARAAASACGGTGAASARQDHRAHSDPQPVPRLAADVPDELVGHRAVHEAESQRTQAVCIMSSMRRDTV